MEELLTPKEASEILKVKERVLCYTLNIPYIKVGGTRRYQRQDIENYIKKNKCYNIDIISYRKSNKVKEYVI